MGPVVEEEVQWSQRILQLDCFIRRPCRDTYELHLDRAAFEGRIPQTTQAEEKKKIVK